MTTVTIDEAHARLPEIIDHLQPGEQVTITAGGEPLAQVTKSVHAPSPSPVSTPRPGPGVCREMITFMSPDFDAPLEDMQEYME